MVHSPCHRGPPIRIQPVWNYAQSLSLSLRLEFNALFITLALLCARDTGVCQAQNGGCGQCGKKEKNPISRRGDTWAQWPPEACPARLAGSPGSEHEILFQLMGVGGCSESTCAPALRGEEGGRSAVLCGRH